MAGKKSKFEGRITIASGTQFDLYENNGTSAITIGITAGDYYWSSGSPTLTGHIKTQLDGSAGAGTYTISIDDGTDTSTGACTISATGVTNFKITWGGAGTALKNRLGFTGTDTGFVTTVTGAEQVEYLWLPSVYRTNPQSPEPTSSSHTLGVEQIDGSFVLATSGAARSIGYTRRYSESLDFAFLPAREVWIQHETTTNESLQKFWQDVLSSGTPFRYHPSRDEDAMYYTCVHDLRGGFRPTPTQPNWVGASSTWNVQLPSYVQP